MNTSILNGSLLAILSITKYSPFRQSREAEDVVMVHFNTGKKAGKFMKALIDPTDSVYRSISVIESRARAYFYENTTPWGSQNATRLLVASKYIDFITRMSELRSEFEDAVEEFSKAYKGLIDEAKIRLGSLFDEHDYLSEAGLKERFSFDVELTPVASAKLSDCHLLSEYAEAIERDANARLDKVVEQSVSSIYHRLIVVLNPFIDKLSQNPVPIFRDSLVENITGATEFSKEYAAIFEDSALIQCVAAVDHFAKTIVISNLRNDRDYQNTCLKEAKRLLSVVMDNESSYTAD